MELSGAIELIVALLLVALVLRWVFAPGSARPRNATGIRRMSVHGAGEWNQTQRRARDQR